MVTRSHWLLAARPELPAFATEIGASVHACGCGRPCLRRSPLRRGGPSLPQAGRVSLQRLGSRARTHRRCRPRAGAQRSVDLVAFAVSLWRRLRPSVMLPHGAGTILLTGASASVKGYPHSAVFAMGKFALRGLAQSMARELAPKGIHVAHFVIDGGVRMPRAAASREPMCCLTATSIPTPSPRATCTSSSGRVALGRGR